MSTIPQEQAPKRPVTVLIALILMYGGIIYSIVELLTELIPDMLSNESVPDFFLLTSWALATCLFSGFMLTFILIIYKIGQGKNWARKLYLAIEVFGIIMVTGMLQTPVDLYYEAADILALALLFWPASSVWFKAMEAHRETVSAT